MNPSIYFLKIFEVAIGNFSEMAKVDDHYTATIEGVCVSIPEEIATLLQPHIGKRVGLLKTDREGYRIKVLG